jgi:alpha-galactosidase
MLSIIHANQTHASVARPGAWNDPDMLEIGNGHLSDAEQKTHFSLWAEMAAPLLIGTDLRKASQHTFDVLGNKDVIAIDQDAKGAQGVVISSSGGLVVYAKPLANGDVAVALFNETGGTKTIKTTAAKVHAKAGASYRLFDLWTKSVRTTSGAISASVPAHGTVIFRLHTN